MGGAVVLDPVEVRSKLNGKDIEGLDRHVAAACFDKDVEGRLRATPMSTVAERLFGAAGHERLLQEVLEQFGRAPAEGQVPFRAHVLMRSMRGMWACCDPDCSEVTDSRDGRQVGRLYTRPQHFCACGSRVLELLYCDHCGDLGLGGFVVQGSQEGRFVAATPADVTPDNEKLVFRRPASSYVWYRPGRPDVLEKWQHNGPG